jgi:hypothetical protein
MQDIDLQLGDQIAKFYDDPLGFVLFSYPWGAPGGILEKYDGPDQWQRDALTRLGEEIRARKFDGVHPVEPIRIVIVSGHGVGKSVFCAFVTHFIMSTRPRARGTVTATTFTQLQTKTWAAIQHWGRLLINRHWFDITGDSMHFRGQKESWAVSAQTSKEENSENFAGQHAADSTSFYLIDEGSGVPEKIWEVAEGGLTDGEPVIIACGNPTKATGKFHRITFGSERARWIKFSVDSRHSKFSNKKLIQQWLEDYGEDSDFFRVRVRGEAPRIGSNQLISNEIVAFCRKYTSVGHQSLPKILSCDPARFGSDRTVIGLRQGRFFKIVGKYSGLDTVQVAARVIEAAQREKPDAIVVDADGLGAGVVDQMKYRGHTSRLFEFHGGQTPRNPNAYFNRRAECWTLMREWLKNGAQIPDEPEIEADLTGPEYMFDAKSRVQLEKKEDLKSRGLASPDMGDCLAMTFDPNVSVRPKAKRSSFSISPPTSPYV